MKTNNIIKLIVLTSIFLLTQSCAIFKMPQKEADTELPNSFKQNNELDSTNVAQVKWNDFFEDPNLIQLIDTAL